MASQIDILNSLYAGNYKTSRWKILWKRVRSEQLAYNLYRCYLQDLLYFKISLCQWAVTINLDVLANDCAI